MRRLGDIAAEYVSDTPRFPAAAADSHHGHEH
jgi:hypothetical protein